MTNEDLIAIQNLVNASRRLLVLTHKTPSLDTMASALSLYLAMTKAGKDATIAMETPPLVELASLVGIDQVRTGLDGKNLLITYRPYNLGDFEKVSYHEDAAPNDSFKLTITPRDGFTPDPKNFSFAFTGTSADLIFTVDLVDPSQLGNLYDRELLAASPIINIDNHDPNKDYGRFNLVEPDAASISEIVTFFLRAVNTTLDQDIANNLYQGIVSATNNFQSPKVAAATFEAAAILLRSGAKSDRKVTAQPIPPPPVKPPAPLSPLIAQPRQPSQPRPLPQNRPTPDWGQPKVYRGTSTA